MPIVYCRNCSKKISAPADSIGRTGKCPQCGAAVPVPAADEQPVAGQVAGGPGPTGAPPKAIPAPPPLRLFLERHKPKAMRILRYAALGTALLLILTVALCWNGWMKHLGFRGVSDGEFEESYGQQAAAYGRFVEEAARILGPVDGAPRNGAADEAGLQANLDATANLIDYLRANLRNGHDTGVQLTQQMRAHMTAWAELNGSLRETRNEQVEWVEPYYVSRGAQTVFDLPPSLRSLAYAPAKHSNMEGTLTCAWCTDLGQQKVKVGNFDARTFSVLTITPLQERYLQDLEKWLAARAPAARPTLVQLLAGEWPQTDTLRRLGDQIDRLDRAMAAVGTHQTIDFLKARPYEAQDLLETAGELVGRHDLPKLAQVAGELAKAQKEGAGEAYAQTRFEALELDPPVILSPALQQGCRASVVGKELAELRTAKEARQWHRFAEILLGYRIQGALSEGVVDNAARRFRTLGLFVVLEGDGLDATGSGSRETGPVMLLASGSGIHVRDEWKPYPSGAGIMHAWAPMDGLPVVVSLSARRVKALPAFAELTARARKTLENLDGRRKIGAVTEAEYQQLALAGQTALFADLKSFAGDCERSAGVNLVQTRESRSAYLEQRFADMRLPPAAVLCPMLAGVVKGIELRGKDADTYLARFNARDWLGLYNAITGGTSTEYPAPEDVDAAAMSFKRKNFQVLLKCAPIDRATYGKPGPVWITVRPDRGYYPARQDSSFEKHPDGLGILHQWEEADGQPYIAYGTLSEIDAKIRPMNEQFRKEADSWQKKINLGEIERAAGEARIQTSLEQLRREVQQLVAGNPAPRREQNPEEAPAAQQAQMTTADVPGVYNVFQGGKHIGTLELFRDGGIRNWKGWKKSEYKWSLDGTTIILRWSKTKSVFNSIGGGKFADTTGDTKGVSIEKQK